MDAAIQAVGLLGKTYSLPIPAEGDDKFNKKAIVETLFSVLSNAKLSTKVCFEILFVNYTECNYICMEENHNLFFLDEGKGCAFFRILVRRRVFPIYRRYRE